MLIDEAFLAEEIRATQVALQQAQQQVSYLQGMLNTLTQLQTYVGLAEPTLDPEPLDAAEPAAEPME